MLKAKAKRSGEDWQLALPGSAQLREGEELELLNLREGVWLLSRPGVLEALREGEPGGAGGRVVEGARGSTWAQETHPTLTRYELAVVRKLMEIRFEERTVPAVQKRLETGERTLLEGMVQRGVLSVFRSAKYKDGVYNIPSGLFDPRRAGEMGRTGAREGRAGAQSGADEADAPTRVGGARTAGPDGTRESREAAVRAALREAGEETAGRADVAMAGGERAKAPTRSAWLPAQSQDGRTPLSSPAHLQKFGYMVLDGENEARAVMEGVKDVQKADPVRGVRGFDRRYYVLRRSFMAQHQDAALERLERGDADVQAVADAAKISPTAASVLLMILADDGEVIEKRKGLWGRA